MFRIRYIRGAWVLEERAPRSAVYVAVCKGAPSELLMLACSYSPSRETPCTN